MKRLIILSFISLIVPYSFGQIYIQPSVGYSFSSYPRETQSILIINNLKTVYKTKLKYGEGMHLSLIIGYNFQNSIFVELNGQTAIYSKYVVSTTQPDLQSLNSFSSSGYFGDINYESCIFQAAPLIGYQVQKNLFRTYFKFGPNFLKSTIHQTFNYINWELDNWEFYPLNTVQVYEYSGKFHVGFQANLGFCYSIKQNLQLVLDFATVYNNYEVNKAKIEYYEIDGVSHLYKIEDTNIEIDKEDNKINHSHYGINVGIRYVFNK